MSHGQQSTWPLPKKDNVASAWPFPVIKQDDSTSKWAGRKHWSDNELAIFAELYVTGSQPEEIATKLGRSTKSVTNQLSDAKYSKTKTARRLNKMIIEKQRVLTTAARTLPQPANHRAAWGLEEDKQLLLAFATGKTPAAIADECGRTVNAIAGRLHALGILIFDKDELTYKTAPQVWLKVMS